MAATTRMMSNLKKMLSVGKINHDVQNSIISVSFNSHVAEVKYEEDGDIYDLVDTQIPDDLRGHGAGTIFAERVFDYLTAKNKKFRLTCEFLQHFYSKNVDKYKKFVVP